MEFYSKNKFEKLVHLVGFIITIYHDARSRECQTRIDTIGVHSHARSERVQRAKADPENDGSTRTQAKTFLS